MFNLFVFIRIVKYIQTHYIFKYGTFKTYPTKILLSSEQFSIEEIKDIKKLQGP